MQTERVAECTGVVKIYWTETGEVHALKGIDAGFGARAVTAVVGPSGSGKSSLLRILAGIDRQTAGSVTVAGERVSELKPGGLRKLRRRTVSWVYQRPSDNLVPYLTARRHLEQAAAARRGSGDDIDAVMEGLGIAGRASHLPSELSGGEQQRLAFAQAMVGSPSLVIADEPTAELDSHSAAALLESVSAFTERGLSFILSTHDPELVRMADATIHLRHGALEGESAQAEMLSVIDEAGRIQLPPRALKLFGDRRAVIEVREDDVRIKPP